MRKKITGGLYLVVDPLGGLETVLPKINAAVNGGIDFESPLGELYRLAGDVERAQLHLMNASKACAALDYPFQYVWSWERLGRARETAGDKTGACAAYETVLTTWGHSRTSRTVRAARDAFSHLGCN